MKNQRVRWSRKRRKRDVSGVEIFIQREKNGSTGSKEAEGRE